VGAGPARERERSSRRDPRDLSPESPHRDRVGPSRTRCKYIPVSSTAAADRFGHPWPKTVLDGPTRSRRSLGNSPPQTHFVERSRRCSDPWRFRCKVSGAMVVPAGTYLARDGQMRAPRGEASVLRSTASRAAERRPSVMGGRARLRGLSDPGRHHHCTASRMERTSPGAC